MLNSVPVSVQTVLLPAASKLDGVWAALCMVGAVYVIFRG